MDKGKAKLLSEGQHRGGGGGALASPVYIFKNVLWETSNVSEFVRNILLSENQILFSQ